MKKFIILLFSVGLVTAVSAQRGDRRYDNGYQSSPYSYNDQYRNNDRYNNRGYHNQYESRRQRMERLRYEMMMKRQQARYYQQRRYNSYPAYGYRKPSLQIRIGIGSRRY